MKDSIGSRLAAYAESVRQAECWRRNHLFKNSDRFIAKHEGAAAGHAFRAAELAYDLGQLDLRFQKGLEPFPFL